MIQKHLRCLLAKLSWDVPRILRDLNFFVFRHWDVFDLHETNSERMKAMGNHPILRLTFENSRIYPTITPTSRHASRLCWLLALSKFVLQASTGKLFVESMHFHVNVSLNWYVCTYRWLWILRAVSSQVFVLLLCPTSVDAWINPGVGPWIDVWINPWSHGSTFGSIHSKKNKTVPHTRVLEKKSDVCHFRHRLKRFSRKKHSFNAALASSSHPGPVIFDSSSLHLDLGLM